MSQTDIILVGGGGHCTSVIDVIESTGQWNILGVLDPEPVETGYPHLGSDDQIPTLVDKGHRDFIITVGHIASPDLRIKLYETVVAAGGNLPTIASKSAIVSDKARIGSGNVIMHGAIVNAGATIADNNIINTGALIEHDCFVGSHNHVSTRAIMNGDCKLGDRNFLGSGSIVYNNISIGSDNLFSAGSIISKSCGDGGKYVTVPQMRKI